MDVSTDDVASSDSDGLVVVSFDIDGTLWAGDPPGPIELDVVLAVAAQGCVIGSASDRPRANQVDLWARHGVEVAFVGGKHHLPEVRQRFADAARFVHIGDTDVDEHYARQAGFEFVWVDRLAHVSGPWIAPVPPA
jgi:FMN phosphatase YigB (HAD superfamily)